MTQEITKELVISNITKMAAYREMANNTAMMTSAAI
jgi:hypothetical protein